MQDLLSLLNDYCAIHSTVSDPLLDKIERQTHLSTTAPRMLSGELQGSLLSMISKIKSPKYVLEIGTFTGYSAICLAEGLKDDGKLITIEYDEEHSHLAKSFFDESQYKNKIELKTGDAKVIIPQLSYMFDLVFIDADKEAYSQYFDLIIDKCHKGALILADNVLWSGKILDIKKDKKTQQLDDFNKKIAIDPRVENVILPIRDGINLIRVI
ncbi:MAG TPA: class I SAM-dependent methyltransferase [Saprospiraceae bacterium]|nr:class I SAM-dependent methyltransferase [Saprospiraceae bacterium]HMU04207.1 class I SAM-dependent methyltransferase [Saprospiraceae bacterium]